MIVFSQARDANSIVQSVGSSVVDPIITLIGTVAFLVFLFGIFTFVISSREGDAEKRKTAQAQIFSGILGLFVIFSYDHIIRILKGIGQGILG